MTTVRVEREGEGIRRLLVSGHAGYAKAGRDIVCAAVSVLTTTCVNALETVAGVRAEVEQDERQASLSIRLPSDLPQSKRHDAQVILQSAVQGFRDLSGEYPEHLDIIDGRQSPC